MALKIKKILITLCILSAATILYAQPDRLSVTLPFLSVHPENQRDLADHYDRKLDSHGDFVITPGIMITCDLYVPFDMFSHIRFNGSYISDCAKLPAGAAGAGVVIPLSGSRDYSLNWCIEAALFARKDWHTRIENYYSPVLKRRGNIEWVVLPCGGIDFCFHPGGSDTAFVISFYSIIYISLLSAGFQISF